MTERLFTPLKMTHTTARQPPEPALIGGRVHRLRVGRFGLPRVAVPLHAEPSGRRGRAPRPPTWAGSCWRCSAMARSTACGCCRRRRARRCCSRSSAAIRGCPASPTAFRQWATHGRLLLHHDGTLGDQVAGDAAGSRQRLRPVRGIERQPGHRQPPARAGAHTPVRTDAARQRRLSRMPRAPDARRVAGVYLDTQRTRHDLSRIRALMPMLQSRVTADDGGAITWDGRRWIRGGAVRLSGLERRRHARLPAGRRDTRGRDADLERHLRAHRVDAADGRPSRARRGLPAGVRRARGPSAADVAA